MANTLRALSAVALCVALTPLAAAQGIDCNNIPVSAGAPDPAYRACARPSENPIPNANPSDLSFGHDGVNTNFVTFVQNTPEVFSTVAPYVPPDFLGALDFQSYVLGTAFGLETSNQALSISTTTGAVTVLGTIAPSVSGEQWTAITYDFRDDTFYALASQCGVSTSLYRVNFQTLTATLIGTDNTDNETCGLGLASRDSDGALYGFGVVSDQLLRYDKNTGQSTVIGPLGYSANFGQAMDFDNDDGTCYIYAFNDITFQAELRTCNTTTGRTTLVGPLGSTDPGGLTQIGAGASLTTGELPQCSLSFTNPDISPNAVAPGGTVTFSGNVVVASWSDSKDISLRAHYEGPGGVDGLINLGAANNVPPGTYPFSRNVRVPSNAPSGSYLITLLVIDSGDGSACGDYSEAITVTNPPRLSGTADGSVLFEVVAPSSELFGTRASTVAAVMSPNPLAGRTTLRFALAEVSAVRLAVYDVLGRAVHVVNAGRLETGPHRLLLDLSSLPSGMYVWRLVAGERVETGRLTVAR